MRASHNGSHAGKERTNRKSKQKGGACGVSFGVATLTKEAVLVLLIVFDAELASEKLLKINIVVTLMLALVTETLTLAALGNILKKLAL